MEQRFVLAKVPRSGARTTTTHTTLEGEWDEVMPVIKRACDAVAEVSPRVSLVLKADLRPGYTGQLAAKVERIEQHLDVADS
ncbi:thiamine-binding protein [Georgenia sp. Z1491]|uniref:thiamine-binding protein n=1 Tax=Georgenia sp. Z1491 TaxID=3416707 RepID=UPI003CF1EF3D